MVVFEKTHKSMTLPSNEVGQVSIADQVDKLLVYDTAALEPDIGVLPVEERAICVQAASVYKEEKLV